MSPRLRLAICLLVAIAGIGIVGFGSPGGLTAARADAGAVAVDGEVDELAAADASATGPVMRVAAQQPARDRVEVYEATANGEVPRPDAVVEFVGEADREWTRMVAAEGGFVVPRTGKLLVRARLDGLEPVQRRFEFLGTTLRLVLRRRSTVAVRFVDGVGSPVAGVHVAISRRGAAEDADGTDCGLASREVSGRDGWVVWDQVAAFVDHRYVVTSGHDVVCEPIGDRPGVSGTFVPAGEELRFQCVVAGHQISGQLAISDGDRDVLVRLFRIVDDVRYPATRQRPCFAAGRAFHQVGEARPAFEVSEGTFSFGALTPGSYVVRARWRSADGRRWTFLSAPASVPEGGARVELGRLQPLASPPQRIALVLPEQLRDAASDDLVGSLRARVAVNSGSGILGAAELTGWIDDCFEVQGRSELELVGLPRASSQFDLRELVVAPDSGWVFGQRARIEVAREQATDGVAFLPLSADKAITVRLRTDRGGATSSAVSGLAVVVREGQSGEPPQVTTAPLALDADGTVHTRVPSRAGMFSAYVFVESSVGDLAGFLVGQRLHADSELHLTLAPCEPVELVIAGTKETGDTLEFAPAGFGYPVSASSVHAGRVVVKGIPSTSGVDCWGLPAGATLRDHAGRRVANTVSR